MHNIQVLPPNTYGDSDIVHKGVDYILGPVYLLVGIKDAPSRQILAFLDWLDVITER